MRRVRRSTEVPSSDEVDLAQLRDHMPLLLDDLANAMEAAAWEPIDPDTDSDASAHGYFRWHQGYDLSEVLHELSLLRAIVLEVLVTHEGADLALHQRTHLFLDDVARISTLRFAQQQQAAIETISASRLGLLNTVSHEVRNAVNSIHLVREVQRRTAVTPIEAPLQGTLDRTVLHLKSLLDNLLDFTRLSEGHIVLDWVTLDPRQLAEDLEATFRESCEHAGLEFVVHIDPTLGDVDTDLTSLRQVSGNLLSNALKYTSRGRVTLSLVDFDAHTWRLEVADTGMGMAEDAQARLFEEFYRAPGAAHIQGTGLGLGISKRLVEALGGSMVVRSVLGEGSTFAALLPKVRARTAPAAGPPS